jgi:hypothetical protein
MQHNDNWNGAQWVDIVNHADSIARLRTHTRAHARTPRLGVPDSQATSVFLILTTWYLFKLGLAHKQNASSVEDRPS